MLRSDLCKYSDAYLFSKGDITIIRQNNNAYDKKLCLKKRTIYKLFIKD